MRADPHTGARDEGSAMILVLMVLVLLTALSATLGAVTLSNLQGSRRAGEASRVVNVAEAGVSQALTFIRQNGVKTLRCRKADPADATPTLDCTGAYGLSNPVGSPAGIPDGARFSAWVEEIERFVPNSDAQGVYLVHSVGTIGGGARATCQGVSGPCRSVTARVVVSDFGFGSGIYSKSIRGNSAGNATIENQSLFTTGCFPMRGRASLKISGFDAAHGIHAGVHTSGIIVDGPASGCDQQSNSIHAAGACNKRFPFDQDSQGGPLSTTGDCAAAVAENEAVFGLQDTDSDGVFGSRIVSQTAMQETFGLKYPPLTPDQVERLKAIADEDHTYSTTTAWPSSTAVEQSRGVVFFDLTARAARDAEVELGDIPYPLNAESGACRGAIVIIRDGNAKVSSSNKNTPVGASVFLLSSGGARGIATLNGGYFYGGLFAEAIDFSGDTYLRPADCDDDSSNPALLTVTMTSYSEDD